MTDKNYVVVTHDPSTGYQVVAIPTSYGDVDVRAVPSDEKEYITKHGLALAEAQAAAAVARACDKARKNGHDDGFAAAQWLLDGNSTQEAAQRLLDGINDGDPEIMDMLPNSPLSGEFADGMTEEDVLRNAGVPYEEPYSDAWDHVKDEIITAYEDGYTDGAQDGAETVARNFLGLTA